MLVNTLMLNEFAVVKGSFIHQCHAQPHKFSDTSFALRRLICNIIALFTNNTVFGPGFSYSDWQNSSRDQSNLESY